MKDDFTYLSHILEAVERISEYLQEADYESFLKNTMMADAVIKNFEIIGEAANNVSDDFKQNHPELPWLDMGDMRNKLIHEYFGIDMKIIWDTCQNDLPKLEQQLERILGEK